MTKFVMVCVLLWAGGCVSPPARPVLPDNESAVIADDVLVPLYRIDKFKCEVVKGYVWVPRGRLVVPPSIYER